tara:strand:- start:3840 stop:4982 length:1143 start_codon:yes stop_codon:yes gene_type:complete
MKIGYITKQSPHDVKAYSGTHYSMLRVLQSQFEDVVALGPLDHPYKNIAKLKGRVLRLFDKRVYRYQYNVTLAKKTAAILDKRIEVTKPDVLLGSLVSPEVAYLKSKLPLFLTTDSTFPLLHDVYASHSNLNQSTIKNARELERMAFERATKLIVPLQWIADSAMSDYGISSEKIEVVPYGSNFDFQVSEAQINTMIKKRALEPKLSLLFVGIRWEEKGGPFAVEVLKKIISMGVEAELTVIGSNPEIPNKPEQVKVLGFLDKQDEMGLSILKKSYEQATFFILPTKAECIGMSFIEAASYGLPSIGTDIGGVPEAVVHEKTGFIIQKENTPEEIAEWIVNTWNNEQKYSSFSQNAYSRYLGTMNWKNWSEKVKSILDQK